MDLSEEELMRREDTNVSEEEKLRDYIGDGVYVKYDGVGIWLLANAFNDPSDRIYLEPQVFKALIRFAKRMGWKIE